jgi:23S rRNA maturation mini-RNase III
LLSLVPLQHGHLARLLDGGAITDEELAILKWGRDYGHEGRTGHKKIEHQEASALEALVVGGEGYVYCMSGQCAAPTNCVSPHTL